MTKEEKGAIVALRDFMKSMGANPQEIEQEFMNSMKHDPTMTPNKMREVADLLGFKNTNMFIAASQEKPKNKPENKPVQKIGCSTVAMTLTGALKELKYGRTKDEQDLLDGFLKVIEKKNKELGTILRIKQKMDAVIKEALQLQNIETRDWIIDVLEEIKLNIGD